MTWNALAEGTVVGGEVKVTERLGEPSGARAAYVAQRISGGARCALVVVESGLFADAASRERFAERARAAARVESAHVAPPFAAGYDEAADAVWVAADVGGAEPLGKLVAQRGALDTAAAVELVTQLCDALEAAHRAELVHGGVDPNLLFVGAASDGQHRLDLKVAGFGVADAIARARAAKPFDERRSWWMAPEQMEAPDAPPARAADVWTVGLVAFYALTARHYWVEIAGAETSIASRLILDASERAREYGCPERIPRGFDPWFARCMAREPGKRFASAEEARRALVEALRPAPVASVPAPPPAPPPFPQPFAPMPAYAAPPAQDDSGWSAAAIVAVVMGSVVLLGIILVVVFMVIGFTAARKSASAARTRSMPTATAGSRGHVPPWSDMGSPIPITSADPMWGDRAAPVTIVEFADFQCPFCKRAETTLAQIKATYPHEVRIVWKNYPLTFHPEAKPAAEAGEGVFELGGDDAFWRFHDLAYAGQSSLGPSSYESWAQVAGVDAMRIRSGLATHEWAAKIQRDTALAQSVKVEGTPQFYVNGISLGGAQPFEVFQKTIDDELAQARALIAAGTPATRVYVERSKVNFGQVGAKGIPAADAGAADGAPKFYRVPIGTSPVRGKADALVTIVEFSDFQCPFCKRVEPTIDALRAKYGADLRVVWKDMPLAFHVRAEPAAELAREARAEKGDDTFWRAHDLLFAAQPSLADADLDRVAEQLGLRVDAVHLAISTKRYASGIQEDTRLAGEVGATGTPTFFINGHQLVGAQPQEKFEKVIDEELTKAKALVAQGTPRAKVYDAATADAGVPR